jgi:UDP-glucose 4-epimerase
MAFVKRGAAGAVARIQEQTMDYDGVNVLVTGADGFIGSHLTEKLVSRGANVTALCLYNSFDCCGWLDDLAESTRVKIKIVRGDIRDAAFVRRIVRGQEVVFHLAALIAIPHSYIAAQSYVDTNVLGTLNLLEAARENGIVRLVHTSTSEVYGSAITVPITESHPLQGQSPYSASKIGADMMAEAFTRSFELPIAILRPFNTFGPRQSERAVIAAIIRQALDPHCSAIFIGDSSSVRDFTFVEDTVEAFLAIGISPNIQFGRPYNAGSGEAVTIMDVVNLVIRLTNCDKPTIERNPERMRPAESEVRFLQADSSLFKAETGWQPRIDLCEGIKRTIAWWRTRLSDGGVRREAAFIT